MSPPRAASAQPEPRGAPRRRQDSVEEVRAALAHDFNHMLAVIVGASETIAAHPNNDPEDRKLALVALHAAERGAQLLRRIMALAPGRSAGVEPVEAGEILESAADFARLLVPRSVELSVRATKTPLVVRVDSSALESALLNLCINAGQALAEGGRLTLDLRRARLADREAENLGLKSGDYAAFCVRDDGPGMAPEVLARATEARFTTRAGRGGSGLGLSSVERFARSAGGALSLSSRPHEGVTAVIYLPLAEPAAAPK